VLLGREKSSPRGHGAPAGAPAPQLSLNLKGGRGGAALTACGAPHHYTIYRAGERIKLGGSVTAPPAGRWKVKLKLKACIGGEFRASGGAAVRVRSDGTFKGAFPAPVPGLYFARAQLNLHGRRLEIGRAHV